MDKRVKKIACIGECMIELAPANAGFHQLGYAGDTFNTAVYLKRQFADDVEVSYVSAVGDDPLSHAMIERFDAERISTELLKILPGQQPGLYLIENDEHGERYFQYWRSNSAARLMFDGMSVDELFNLLSPFDLIYLSGISLAILDDQQRSRLISALGRLQTSRVIAFDPNFRSALWPDLDSCSSVYSDMAAVSSIVLATLDDDKAIWGDTDVIQAIDRWQGWGAQEVVVKDGANGCTIFDGDKVIQVPTPATISPVDTTGAGDSFCAGYCGARIQGASSELSARLAHNIAAQVIQHSGGVIDADSWSVATGGY